MKQTLRPYQQKAKSAIYEHIREGRNAVLVVAPTGSGKSSLAAGIVEDAVSKGKRCVFIAHRIELLEQMLDRVLLTGLPAETFGVIAGAHKLANVQAPVQMASVQTLGRREPASWPVADVLFIDESHRATSGTYLRVIDEYKSRGAKIIGLTATPKRLDGRGFDEIFDVLVSVSTPAELVADGYLAAPKYYGVNESLQSEIRRIKTTAGDYDKGEASKVMNRRVLVSGIVNQWRERAAGLRTIVFCSGVDHARALAEQFCASGVKAEAVAGNDDSVSRSKAMDRFRSGTTQVLCNAELYIEGIDVPAAKCCILARPTKSLTYYLQMVGRVMRPWNNVEPVVLDHAGCVSTHGFVTDDREWSLAGMPDVEPKDAPQRIMGKQCEKCFLINKPGVDICVGCGAEMIQHIQILEVDGELEELRPISAEESARLLNELEAEAAKLGHRPGWAIAEYVRRYGQRPLVKLGSEPEHREYWERLKAESRAKGYKHGWAFMRFRARFNCDPPKSERMTFT